MHTAFLLESEKDGGRGEGALKRQHQREHRQSTKGWEIGYLPTVFTKIGIFFTTINATFSRRFLRRKLQFETQQDWFWKLGRVLNNTDGTYRLETILSQASMRVPYRRNLKICVNTKGTGTALLVEINKKTFWFLLRSFFAHWCQQSTVVVNKNLKIRKIVVLFSSLLNMVTNSYNTVCIPT